ncbi:transposable element Tcb1 transposase [Trichonephila clavipes]|nr:transposable element Tcb1 transposase [Trichonephila clavipes]
MMEAGSSDRRVTRQLETLIVFAATLEETGLQWDGTSGRITALAANLRFNLSSDDNRVRVWGDSRDECLNALSARLRRHTAPTAGVMVWSAIAYNTWLPLVLIRGHHDSPVVCPVTSCRHTCFATHATAPRSRVLDETVLRSQHRKGVTKLSPWCYYPSLTCPTPKFVSNPAYLGSFGTARVGHPTSLNEL